jgi:Na+-transporting NADH:ubiquinone oxidoreductase subunit A
MRIAIPRGLNVELTGCPEQTLAMGSSVAHVAVKGTDYRGLKPTLRVKVNDHVRLGEVLFVDRLDPRLRVTAPGAGVIVAINRGVRRSLTSVVIRLDGNAAVKFADYTSQAINSLNTDQVQRQLLQSGLWTAFRARPFERVPSPATKPRWLFVTAMDTNPGALDPQLVIAAHKDAWADGLRVLARVGAEAVYVCHGPKTEISIPEGTPTIRPVQFDGPHPAGLPGTHIHYLARPDVGAEAWHINYQDVVAVGKLFRNGELWTERSIALSGAGARRPRVLRTRLGAKLSELLRDERTEGQIVLSGPILSGQRVGGTTDFLGRYHQQVCILPTQVPREGRWVDVRRLASWLQNWLPESLVTGPAPHVGSGLLPVEAFESVWPFANAPIPLLRALLVGDAESAETQGCLALAEEDLALLSAVCPAKRDYGTALRRTLHMLEQD